MTLHRRIERLGERLPGPRPAGVPTDAAVLLAGLLAGAVTLDDLDRTDADQVSAVAYAAALLYCAAGLSRPAPAGTDSNRPGKFQLGTADGVYR